MAKAKRVQAEEWDYVLRDDRGAPAAERSTFRLRPMSLPWQARAWDSIVVREDGAPRLRSYQTALDIVREHVVAVANFPAGKPEPWPADGDDAAKDAYLARLGPAAVHELGHHVWDMCSLDAPPDTGVPSLGESSA